MADFLPLPNRDAWATIRGYVYQVEHSILRWFELQPGEELELERGEDIDLVLPGLAESQEELHRRLEQVKHRDKGLTLRSTEAMEALANYYSYRANHPQTLLFFRFTTNAQIGREQLSPMPNRMPALSAWEQLRAGALDQRQQEAMMAGIRQIVTTAKKPQGVGEENWKPVQAVQVFFKTASDLDLLDFIQGFEWSTNTGTAPDLGPRIRVHLHSAGYAKDEVAAQTLYERLFLYVFKVLTNRGIKRLTREALLTQLAPPALSADDVALLHALGVRLRELEQRMARVEGVVAEQGSVLTEIQATLNHLVRPEGVLATLQYSYSKPVLDVPPLVDQRSERTETVQHLLEACQTQVWVALTGSTGCGKTQLAILLAHALNTMCIWLSLRDLSVAEAGQKLDAACESIIGSPAPAERTQWFRSVCAALAPGAGIILDDLPRCRGNDELATRLSLLVQTCADAGIHMITTSAHPLPSQLRATLNAALLYELQTPLFTNAEAADLFRAYGAPEQELQPAMVSFLNSVAQQHPTLLAAMAHYLEGQGWHISDETFEELIRSQFTSAVLDEIMDLVRATVTDTQTSELLYRLTLNRRASTFDDVQALAQVSPSIERPRERLSALSGLWVQRNAGERYEVSPLVSAFGMTELAPATAQACHNVLGSRIVAQQSMTPPQLIEAMMHFHQAAKFDRAGALFAFALAELTKLDTQIPDFGLLSVWADQPLPADMSLGLRLHIRGLQIAARRHRGVGIEALLVSDLDTLVAQATEQEAWAVISIVVSTTSIVDPTRSLFYLRTALRLAPHGRMPDGEPLMLPKELTFEDLIWAQVPLLETTDHLDDWIQTLEQMTPEQLAHACADDFAEQGCLALAEQLWLRELDHLPEQRNWPQVLDLLDELAWRAHIIGAELLWACAMRARIAVRAEYCQDLEGAVRDGEAALAVASSDPRIQLLMRECVGRQYLYADQRSQAVQWLQKAFSYQTSAYPRIQMVALLSASRALVSEDIAAATSYAQQAVDLVRSTEEIPETDLVRALGELAIVKWLSGDLNETFSAWDDAGERLFACQAETDLWKALCVMYGHISGYLTSVAIQGQPPEVIRGGTPYVTPQPGMLLSVQTNRTPLYEARKAAYLASQLAMFAEAVGQDARAAVWAKRGLEWAQESHQWLVLSALGRKLLAPLIRGDRYADTLESALESGALQAAMDTLRGQGKDLSTITGEIRSILGEKPSAKWEQAEYYSAIIGLLPIAFRLAWHTLQNPKQAEHYGEVVSGLCQEIETTASDKALWRTAAEMFQAAFVQRKSADELMRQTAAINPDKHPVLRAIAYIFASLAVKGSLSSAYQMHRSIWSYVVGLLRQEPAIYRQVVTPFLVEFWTQRFSTQRFRFRSPTLVEAELTHALSLPDDQKAQAVLNAVALGLG